MEKREYREAIHNFEASLALARSLLKEGLMTEEEFTKIKKKLAKKYGLKNKSVFLDK